jgi:predicted TPR repeat methyltransferase
MPDGAAAACAATEQPVPSSGPDGHRPNGADDAEPRDLVTVELEPGHAALLMEEVSPGGADESSLAALGSGASVAVRMPAGQALGLAMTLHRSNRLEAAERFYRAVLARDDAPPGAGHFFGILLHATGRSAEGLGRIRRSMAALQDQAWAWNNLGNVLNQAGDGAEAEAAYRAALSRDPDFPEALNNLGTICRRRQDWEEADALYRRAIALRPDFAEAFTNRGKLLIERGRIDEAVLCLSRAMVLDPSQAAGSRAALARAYIALGDLDRAAVLYREWAADSPDDPVPLHLLRACTGEAPPRAPDDYVTKCFDGFAARFDETLARLGYRAPDLVAAAVAAAHGPEASYGAVADLGCGTGLCGPLLRGRAARLVGVDLSPSMLAKAAARAVYDELCEMELTAFLLGRPGGFDTLLSADTLCYFGDLEAFAAAARSALRPGGALVFTVERLAPEDAPYRLLPSGRYAHSEAYLRSCLAGAGLEVAALAEDVLRSEAGRPVQGLVVTARAG